MAIVTSGMLIPDKTLTVMMNGVPLHVCAFDPAPVVVYGVTVYINCCCVETPVTKVKTCEIGPETPGEF